LLSLRPGQTVPGTTGRFRFCGPRFQEGSGWLTQIMFFLP
jgi:hypothetical protein